jgi:hypothetical protein
VSTEFTYRADILEALWAHAVRPTETTSPQLVHGFVSDLYRYEIRKLRDRVVRKEFPKVEYFDRVVALRRRYRVIAMRPDEWLV